MALFFNKCDVAINGSGVMADSASINTSNSLEPIRSVGKKGIIYQAPVGPLQATYDISYMVETNNEPNYNIVQALRSLENSFHNKGVVVEVGGISALCYLTQYSLTSAPNEPVKANVSYQSWQPTTGSLSDTPLVGPFGGGAVSYNSQRSSGIAHGWTTYISTSANALTNKSYGFDYNFQMNWEPAFAFQRLDPYDVRFINAAETINLVRDTHYDVFFSGSEAARVLLATGELTKEGIRMGVPKDKNINLHSVGILCDPQAYSSKLSFDLSDATIVSTNVNASLDDLVKTTLTLKNYY